MRYLNHLFFFLVLALSSLYGEIIKQEGQGFLEKVDNQLILHLKGDDYQRGLQHGKLLNNLIRQNVYQFVDTPNPAAEGRRKAFIEKLDQMMPFIPVSIIDELMGLSEGSQIPFQKLLMMNLFPEMFHCSAISLKGFHTQDGKLYHVRALDYSIGKGLQNTSVLIVSSPDHKLSNLSVSYAGFIGCITGMNEAKISLGEVGGLGYGEWSGSPMSFIMKQALENAKSLEEAKQFFEQARTCEYFYLISDGNNETSLGLYATASQLCSIEPGRSYSLIAPGQIPTYYGKDGSNDKFFISPFTLKSTPFQTILYNNEGKVLGLFHQQPSDAIIITGYSSPNRYPFLAEAIASHQKPFSVADLQSLLNPQTTLASNLHNAIFLPSELKVWISHAGPNNEPAYTQPYSFYDLKALLRTSQETDLVKRP